MMGGFNSSPILKGLLEAAESLGEGEFFSRDLVETFEAITGRKYSPRQIGHIIRELVRCDLLESKKALVPGEPKGYRMQCFRITDRGRSRMRYILNEDNVAHKRVGSRGQL